MSEEIDDNTTLPGTMKLEGDKIKNVDPQPNEASDNEAIVTDDTRLKTGEITIDVEHPTSEASESDLYPRITKHDIVYEEEQDQLEESYDSSFKEEGESSRTKSDTTEDIIITGQSRNKPTLVIVGSNHKFNVKSRYLSDPFSSCHDHCKFGHKHESEKSERKTRRLTLGTIRESQPLNKTSSEDPGKGVLEKVTKKKEFDRRLSLPGSVPEKVPLMDLEVKNGPKDVTRSKMKQVESERKSSLIRSPQSLTRTKISTQAVKKIVTQTPNLEKTSTRKLKEVKTGKDEGSNSKGEMEVKVNEKEPVCSSQATSVNEEGGYSEDVVKEVKAKELISESPKSTLRSGYVKGVKDVKAKISMSSSPKTPLKRSSSLKARLYKDHRSSLNSRNQISSGGPKVGDDDRIETNPDMKELEKTLEVTVSGQNSRQSIREARGKKPEGFKGNGKGIHASSLNFSSRESTKPRGEKLGSEMTKTKKSGFKPEESGSKTSMPREKPTTTRLLKSLDFKNTKNNAIRDDSRSKTNTPREKLSVGPNLKPKRKEKSNVEEKDASAWKVKFKRGTVVALQVANNAPKRLRFRRARTLGDDQTPNGESDRKSKNELCMGNEDDKVGPEKVRLRHQETSEKKDDVDLNNVIEETASKLVKTRKSKVKALVGAFETVMSLGDRKRVVETGSS